MDLAADLQPATAPEHAAHPVPRRQKPQVRVAALAVVVFAAAAAAEAGMWLAGLGAPGHALVPVWGIAALFVVTEGFVIHLQVRRGGHAVSLADMPTVFGLLGLSPVALFAARFIGGGLGLATLRRQRGVKLAFNLALLAAQSAAASAAFVAVGGIGNGMGPRQWLAAYAATIAGDVIATVLVTAVISLHDDPGAWRQLPEALAGLPLVVVSTSVALVGALALTHDPWAVLPLGAVTLVTFLASRAYSRQTQGHQQVEQLYAFTQALDGSRDAEDTIQIVLSAVRDQIRAETAELIIVVVEGAAPVRMRLSGQGRFERDTPDPDDRWWAPAAEGHPVLIRTLPGRAGPRRTATTQTSAAPADPDRPPYDAIAVPVPIGPPGSAVLLVRRSLPDVVTFDSDHVRLFRALANHASVALAKARLVDELRVKVKENAHQALHDSLTGLPNRRHFHQLLEAALTDRAADAPLAVLLLDLDRFKEVNDALGHHVGDNLLRQVAIRLQVSLAGRGAVARMGGDEFGVLLTAVDSTDGASDLADELAHTLEQPIVIDQMSLDARAGIGIAVAPTHGNDATALLQRAEVAMYAAKQTASGRRIYHPDDDHNTPRRLAFTAELRRAIEERDLLVAFQPKFDPRLGVVTGAETLARWHQPGRGFVPPDEFISVAEHSGLIRPLTLQILETALRRCAAWRRRGHQVDVAVNLSPTILLDSALPDVISSLLGQTGLPAAVLTLEITESGLVVEPRDGQATLERLHALGVKLSIDDFGTGYSSLGRLRQLPIHEMKIDKSFVQRLAVDHRDLAVVRAAVQLGHALDLQVVAEGVEDEHTLDLLVREGCNLVQGYLISEPLLGDQFLTWLERSQVPALH